MQYFIREKALFFKDYRAAGLIRQTQNRQELKALASRLDRFGQGDWPQYQLGVMRDGMMAKFSQNSKLRTHLLKTGDAVIAKTGLGDTTWGIGWNKQSALARNVLLWDGFNLLGYLLMDVRAYLIKG